MNMLRGNQGSCCTFLAGCLLYSARLESDVDNRNDGSKDLGSNNEAFQQGHVSINDILIRKEVLKKTYPRYVVAN